jgi:nucleoside-diphosphate-sugar epimerase
MPIRDDAAVPPTRTRVVRLGAVADGRPGEKEPPPMERETKPILVYGAAGTRGGPVARQLLAAGHPVRVLSRNPAQAAAWRQRGAEAVVGDLADRPSLDAANVGTDAVFFHLPVIYDVDRAMAYVRSTS